MNDLLVVLQVLGIVVALALAFLTIVATYLAFAWLIVRAERLIDRADKRKRR